MSIIYSKINLNHQKVTQRMKVTVDEKTCIGCGACVAICPSIFKMKNSKSIVKKLEGAPCAKEAEEACPVDSIKVK